MKPDFFFHLFGHAPLTPAVRLLQSEFVFTLIMFNIIDVNQINPQNVPQEEGKENVNGSWAVI